jgi:hypothetical protein
MARSPLLSRPKRSWWILLAALALGVVVLAFFGSRMRTAYRTELTGCAHDNGTGGASGVFRWAKRMGFPAQLLDVPVWEAAQALAQDAGHCVLTMGNDSWSPTGAGLEPAHWQDLRDWLARGNTLVVVTAVPARLPATLRRALVPSTFLEKSTDRSLPLSDERVPSRPEIARAPVASGGILTVESKGPRWWARSKETLPGQLAADAHGGVLFRLPVERGAVYVLLDDFAWTNAGFDQDDNARVLAGLLGRELKGGVLALDEYRHGHGRTESFTTYLLNLPGSAACLQLAALWAIFYLYGRNVRLRPAEVYVERERRTAQEYIDAVAQLYERARAAPLAVEAVARRLRQLARASASAERPPAVDALLERAAEYTKSADRPAAPSAATHLVQELIQLRKRIYGTRTVS